MDFKSLKEKALKLKEKASGKTQDVIDYGAKKLTNSKYTIEDKKQLIEVISKTANTKFKTKKDWKIVTYKHRAIVIFADEWSDFFKEALFALPMMITKTFAQNVPIKLAKSKITWVKLSDYKVRAKTLPCLVVIENKKVIKNIEWSEKILKLVKSFHLDINKLIDKA